MHSLLRPKGLWRQVSSRTLWLELSSLRCTGGLVTWAFFPPVFMQVLKSLAELWKTGNFLVWNWQLSGLELATFWSWTGNFMVDNWWLSVVRMVRAKQTSGAWNVKRCKWHVSSCSCTSPP